MYGFSFSAWLNNAIPFDLMSNSDSFMYTDGTLASPSSATLGSPCSVTVGTPSSGAFRSDSDSKTSTWKSSSRLSQISQNLGYYGNKILNTTKYVGQQFSEVKGVGLFKDNSTPSETESDQTVSDTNFIKDISFPNKVDGLSDNKFEETGGFVVMESKDKETKVPPELTGKRKKPEFGLCKETALCDLLLVFFGLSRQKIVHHIVKGIL